MTTGIDDVERVVPIADLRPDTGLLVTGPPLSGLDRMGARFVADALDRGGAGIVLATDRDAATVAESVLAHTADERAADRLGVVDAVGREPPADAPYRAASIGSPADLTGIGMRLTELVDDLDAGDGRLHVVVDSLSTMLVYTEFKRLYRFTDVMLSRLFAHDATVLGLVSSEADASHLERLRTLFDGQIELRETDAGVQYRRRGLGRHDTDWRPFHGAGEQPGGETTDADRPARTEAAPRADAPGLPADPDPPASLHALIETVRAGGYTVTVCNHTGGEGSLAELRDYFTVHNVRLRTADLGVDTPRDAAILHRDADPVAVSGIGPLRSAIRVEDGEPGDDAGADGPPRALGAAVRPDLLDELDRREYTVENGGKRRMVRISRLVETLALEAGAGTLHAGFQKVDRINEEADTRRLYDRIAGTDAAVHLYGTPTPTQPGAEYTIHAGDDEELADSWFVVFDGGGDPDRAAALVSEETAPGEYTGFWTYRADIVGAVDEYLRSTYW